VMDVEHALIAIRSEYLYQSVVPAGLLRCSLYGGQCPEPPPSLALAWVVCEGPAGGTYFFCVEQGLLGGWSSVDDKVPPPSSRLVQAG
jgi:hypothetical protein